MTTLEKVTLNEVTQLFKKLSLPDTSRLTLIIKDNESIEKELQRQKVLLAMQKLKGSGNGKLLDRLLIERAIERKRERVI